MSRTVVLRHDLPDGSSHFDWMLERPPETGGGTGEDARRLLTFRCAVRPDLPEVEEFEAERIGDHRVAYLTYEGEVAGGRGRVYRVGEGEYEDLSAGADSLEVVVRFRGGAGPRVLVGRKVTQEFWKFSLR